MAQSTRKTDPTRDDNSRSVSATVQSDQYWHQSGRSLFLWKEERHHGLRVMVTQHSARKSGRLLGGRVLFDDGRTFTMQHQFLKNLQERVFSALEGGSIMSHETELAEWRAAPTHENALYAMTMKRMLETNVVGPHQRVCFEGTVDIPGKESCCSGTKIRLRVEAVNPLGEVGDFGTVIACTACGWSSPFSEKF